jgi:hypothetical protein
MGDVRLVAALEADAARWARVDASALVAWRVVGSSVVTGARPLGETPGPSAGAKPPAPGRTPIGAQAPAGERHASAEGWVEGDGSQPTGAGAAPVLAAQPDVIAIVAPYLPGGSLAARARSGAVLTAREVGRLLRPVAGALAAAHEAGLVHGGVSAGTILFDENERARLLDAGLALRIGRFGGGSAPPRPAHLRGSGAPRARTGRPGREAPPGQGPVPDAASDVRALAALAWHLLGGRSEARAAIEPRAGEILSAGLEARGGGGPSAADVERALSWLGAPPARLMRAPAEAAVVGQAAARALGPPVRESSPGRAPGRRRRAAVGVVVTAALVSAGLLGTGLAGAGLPGAAGSGASGVRPSGAGDQVVVGRWWCGAVPTPALYDPRTGEVFWYGAGARPGRALAPAAVSRTGVRGGRVALVRGRRCDRLALATPAAP